MSDRKAKETKGAWIAHHGQKVALDAHGAAEFPAIDEAAKAANLLSRLGETNEAVLDNTTVQAVARAAGLNPRYELEGLLSTLEKRRLIDRSAEQVAVLGVTTRGVLSQAADMFDDASPGAHETAAIELAEMSSSAPVARTEAEERIGDQFGISSAGTAELCDQSEQIGFVDAEGTGVDKLIFNGHLFRRDGLQKAAKVLSSLSSIEQHKVNEFDEVLRKSGCLPADRAEAVLGVSLFQKMKAAAVYDLNTVSNESGEHVFVTRPSAFHKFVDPLVDDTFDMAKALVSAFYFGMTQSSSTRGQITMIELLVRKLIRGESVGPAPAIGKDYRVLEERRVVKITRTGGRFLMSLLKKEVGELALQVLRGGDANSTAVMNLPSAPMSGYTGPEGSRTRVRKNQSERSKREMYDVIGALRSGRGF